MVQSIPASAQATCHSARGRRSPGSWNGQDPPVTSKNSDRLCLGGQLGEFIWLHWILRPWPQPWPGQQKGTQRAPAPDDPQGRGAQALRPARSPAPPPGASLCFNCLLLHEKPLQNLKQLGSAGQFFFAVVIPHGVR